MSSQTDDDQESTNPSWIGRNDEINIAFIDHEGQIYLRAALADHVHVGGLDCLEQPRRDAGSELQIITHYADNRFLPLNGHCADSTQVALDRLEPIDVVESYR